MRPAFYRFICGYDFVECRHVIHNIQSGIFELSYIGLPGLELWRRYTIYSEGRMAAGFMALEGCMKIRHRCQQSAPG